MGKIYFAFWKIEIQYHMSWS